MKTPEQDHREDLELINDLVRTFKSGMAHDREAFARRDRVHFGIGPGTPYADQAHEPFDAVLEEHVRDDYAGLMRKSGVKVRNFAMHLFSWLALRVDPETDAEVIAETIGTTTRLSVDVPARGDRPATYLGQIELSWPGGESACLTSEDYVYGVKVTLAGTVASEYMCGDPGHKAHRATTKKGHN